MYEGELAQAMDDLWSKSSTRNWIPGRLGRADGTDEDIDVEGRPGYVYVSIGADGLQGLTTALDKVGAARTNFQAIKMRRELGQLVIREASLYAGASDGGAGGTLNGLTDVLLSGIADGQVLTYSTEIGQWRNEAGGAGTGMIAHDLSGVYHTGLLNWTQVNKTGSALSDLSSRNHSQLTGIGPNQHHNQIHDIIGDDHTVIGSRFEVVGLSNTNTLDLLPSSSDPGSAEMLLRTDVNGGIILDNDLFVADGVAHKIYLGGDLAFTNGDRFITTEPLGDLTFSIGTDAALILASDDTFRSNDYADGIPIAGFSFHINSILNRQLTINTIKSDEFHTRLFVADMVRIDVGEEYSGQKYGHCPYCLYDT